MSDQPSPTATPQPFLDFVDKSSLKYFIPHATDFALDQIPTDGGASFDQFLDALVQRESLFFGEPPQTPVLSHSHRAHIQTLDESVDVVLVLRALSTGDDGLQDQLKSTVISLDVRIVNGNVPDRDGSPASEVIYTGAIDGSQDPATIIPSPRGGDASNGGSPEGYTYVIWKKSVFLSRPRIRMQSPSAVFVATASSRSAAGPPAETLQDDYMPNGMASSLNLLEPFGSDPALKGIKPRLSALRVSRVVPLTQQANGPVRSIKSLSELSLRIYPAIHSRIRFTHPDTAPATAAVIAMLEVDFTPFFECEVILDSITLTIPEAIVENLTDQPGLSLPLSCVSHDHITFIYRITPAETDVTPQSLSRDLDIAISAIALVNHHTKPQLRMTWTAAVDFTVPVNPGYGSTMPPIQRAHRPRQLSIGGESATSLTAPSVARPDALPSLEASTTQSETVVQELGITVTFTAPEPTTKIFVGDELSWNVFVVNQSPNQSAAPRKFAMVVIPQRRRNELRVAKPPSMSRTPDGPHGRSELLRDRDVAEAILDDNVVHAMQTSSVVDNAELVCLSADVRIGPLVPGACHAAELKFLALKEGIVGIDAVRIIDLVNNEHVDIRQLPSVIVELRPEGP
ncbi:putative TRAPP complex subunit Trs65 family protein [Rosellinia necatrix]|uniref:Putative TRAPP complex subunit Trs65 family protein n=1 Tax=Rosellinia necatrix TaxID=77044 RepID=A0A1W2TBA4_ROSNE|nr:putative TRAPP complex subunit Trs65 family protein [Rosellinia necatrix]